MPLHLGNTKYKGVFVQNAPNSYQTDIIPAEMQRGKTCVSKGKVLTGTGKAFEKAGYGARQVLPITDMEGNEKYGISIFTETMPNILFLAPTMTGDIPLQLHHILELTENEVVSIGVNQTTLDEVKAFYNGTHFIIYFESIEDPKTKLIYFYGKDNQV